MANTINSSVTVKGAAAGGQASNDNGRGGPRRAAGLVATTAVGLAFLIGLVFSQVHREAQTTAAPASGNLASPLAPLEALPGQSRVQAGALDWEQEERTQVAPGGFVPDQFTYREDHRATSPAPAVRTVEELRFLEQNIHLGTATEFVPDFWTYREDRRDR